MPQLYMPAGEIFDMFKIKHFFSKGLSPLTVFLQCTLVFAGTDSSRVQLSSYFAKTTRPRFSYETYVFSAEDQRIARVRVVADFANDLIQFKNAGAEFIAQYEILVDMLDSKGIRLDGFIEKGSIAATAFAKTNSLKQLNRYCFDFDLPPGSYEMYLEITDQVTKRRLVRRQNVAVPDFRDTLAISDVMLMNAIKFDKDLLPRMPNIIRVYDNPESKFVAYFELYSSLKDSIRMNYRIYDQAGDGFINIKEDVVANNGFVRKLVPLKELISLPGRYLLIVEARVANRKVMQRRSFHIQHWEPPKSIYDDASDTGAVLALKHISKSQEFSKIVRAKGTERQQLIEAFWSERDPTPETPKNELHDEYLERVRHTVENYSNVVLDQRGPDTDRGKTYIVYGPPTEISRNTLPYTTRTYEIWYYKDFDKRFIFVDKNGFGIYKLVHKE